MKKESEREGIERKKTGRIEEGEKGRSVSPPIHFFGYAIGEGRAITKPIIFNIIINININVRHVDGLDNRCYEDTEQRRPGEQRQSRLEHRRDAVSLTDQ